MKKSKKWISLLMAGTMLCGGMLSGCGKGDEAPAEKNGSKAEGTVGSGGETVKKEKITVAIYDRGTLSPEEGTVEKNRWTKWINENAPVEVEFMAIPRWTSSDKYSTLLASNSAPDLILEYDFGILSSMLANGSLMPITDAVDQYSTEYKALLETYPTMRKRGTVNGELYLFTTTSKFGPNHALYIRTDWLDKLGLKMPTTAEEMYTVAEAFAKQDPDGNGVDDTYGYSLSFVGGQQVGYMFGTDMMLDGTDYRYPWDRMKAMTQYKKDLFDNGIVNKDYAADTSGEQSVQDFIAGKLGIVVGNGGVSAGFQKTIDNFYENNPEGKLEVLPLPSSEFGQFGTAINGGSSPVGAINANCKNPEAVIQYVDWLNSSEDIYNMLMYGGEEYSIRNENGSWTPKDRDVFSKKVYGGDYVMAVTTFEFPGDGSGLFDANTESGAGMIEFYHQAVKAYIDCDAVFSKILYGPYQCSPALSSELALISSNTYGSSVMTDNWEKAIVSGSTYTVEQAEADNQKLVEEGKGAKVMEFYQEWYKQAAADGALFTQEDCDAFKK